MGRSRAGLASKNHAALDSNRLPVQLALSSGEAHDIRHVGNLLSHLDSRSMFLADRSNNANWIKELDMKKGAWAHPAEKQPQRSNLLQPASLPRSQQVAPFFDRIKQYRHGATRYGKLAANYLAFVQLPSNRLWLALYEPVSYFIFGPPRANLAQGVLSVDITIIYLPSSGW